MKYTQTGVQDTFKSLVFFPNGMGALILKTGESYDGQDPYTDVLHEAMAACGIVLD